MLQCICEMIHSEILQQNALKVLEHVKTLTNCNSIGCFEPLEIPVTATTSVSQIPYELILMTLVSISLIMTKPTTLK